MDEVELQESWIRINTARLRKHLDLPWLMPARSDEVKYQTS